MLTFTSHSTETVCIELKKVTVKYIKTQTQLFRMSRDGYGKFKKYKSIGRSPGRVYCSIDWEALEEESVESQKSLFSDKTL